MRKPGLIRLDRSSTGIVVVCADCPHWSAFQFEQLAAWRSGAAHEERCHPDRFQARKALELAEGRHADAFVK
ncbi:MAG TPA: hypothetical protein VNQ48_00230 [Microbacteriaceae bacterium]|nr:hypothetical protein [Microbacteriaceae bacterium]